MSPPLPSLGTSTTGSEIFRPRLTSLSGLSPVDGTLDGLTGSFAEQATDWRTLAALTAGGLAYRAGRIGAMGFESGNFVRAASVGVGLGAEVSAFELTSRGLSAAFRRGGPMWPPTIGSKDGRPHGGAPTSHFESNLWRWSGEGGLAQGFLHSLITFGALKGAGHLAQGETIIARHLLQDSAMVLGHHTSGALGITPRPAGSLAEQFLRAEAVNFQMGAGMALAHGVAPYVHGLERGLDLSLQSPDVGAGFPRPQGFHRTGEETSPLQNRLYPAFANAAPLHYEPPPQSRRPTLENRPWVMMSKKNPLEWLFGGRRRQDTAVTPAGRGPDREEAASERPLGYFQSFYDPREVFPLRGVPEGEEMVLGREASDWPGLFPAFFRNISRMHVALRIEENRIEIRSLPQSRGLRINGFSLNSSTWYVLRHGDQIEFVSEARLGEPAPAGQYQGPGVEDSSRPAIFRFFRHHEAQALSPNPPHSLPRPEMAPATIRSAFTELKRLNDSLGGVLHLYSGVLGEVRDHLQRYPQVTPETFTMPPSMLNVGDIINVHRRLCGEPEHFVQIEAEPGAEGVFVPDFRGLLLHKLNFIQEAIRQAQGRPEFDFAGGPSPLDLLSTVRDSLDRMQRTLQILRRFFQTPQEHVFMDAVDGAYEGVNLEAAARTERVRSQTRSLNLTLEQAVRDNWAREFLESALNPRVVRNVLILMGRIQVVSGLPVVGNFYRGLSRGIIHEGFRTVGAWVDVQSGEFVGFRDGLPPSEETLQNWVSQGRREIEEVSLLVDARGSGRIAQVIVAGSRLRSSVRMDLEALRGLQVLPESRPETAPSAPEPSSVFGVTEYRNPDQGEIWRMNFPPSPEAAPPDLRRVEALTPLQESAEADGVPFWTMATLEPLSEGSETEPLQIWTRTTEIEGLSVGDQVQVFRMK